VLSVLLLAGSILVTVTLWLAGFPFFFLFLFIPLIPAGSRPSTGRSRSARTTGHLSPRGRLHEGELDERARDRDAEEGIGRDIREVPARVGTDRARVDGEGEAFCDA